jgi:hypothetical protein
MEVPAHASQRMDELVNEEHHRLLRARRDAVLLGVAVIRATRERRAGYLYCRTSTTPAV